jgi:regulatory protein YycI of two-component signal transduction system YycFG
MDWSKAKTILILALIFTDLLLIATYGEFDFKSGSFNDSRALSEFLAQKNIYVDEDLIPLKHRAMPVLYVSGKGNGDAGGREFAISGESADGDYTLRFHNRKQETISAPQALLMFMAQTREYEHGDIYIDSIEMVYWLDEIISVENPVLEDTALPVWKIVYNGGAAAYIDAYAH